MDDMGHGGMDQMDHSNMAAMDHGNMAGMDHSTMAGMAMMQSHPASETDNPLVDMQTMAPAPTWPTPALACAATAAAC